MPSAFASTSVTSAQSRFQWWKPSWNPVLLLISILLNLYFSVSLPFDFTDLSFWTPNGSGQKLHFTFSEPPDSLESCSDQHEEDDVQVELTSSQNHVDR